MKKLILLSLVFINSILCSQTYNVSEKQIEVTSHVYNSFILELNSGNTVLLQMEPKIEGFLLKVYDNKHEEKISSKIHPDDIKDINSTHIVSFLELNQKAVLFYLLRRDNELILNKLSIEQYTGEYKNEIIFACTIPEGMDWRFINFNFFKIIENQTKDKYAIITGTTEKTNEYKLNITTHNSVSNTVLCKHTQSLKNCYQLELIDGIMDDENIFLCLNKKEKPKDSETVGWWTISEINYVPANKVSVMGLNINSKTTTSTNLQLDEIIYSTKAQFSFDNKNNQLNLLLSSTNPLDKYWKLPDSKTILYKFSKIDLSIKTQQLITNQTALSQAKSKYSELTPDKSNFARFPQFISSDSEGNNTFLFQTIYNTFRSPEGASNMIQQEFAILDANPEGVINDCKFTPYYFTSSGNTSGSFDEFAFHCNQYTKPMAARYFPTEKEYYNFKVLDVENKLVIISNTLPKNSDKKLGDKFYPNRFDDVMNPMIHIVDKNQITYKKILEGEQYNKLRFNVNISSYNPRTKTFSVLATEINGKKERLVWIKFD